MRTARRRSARLLTLTVLVSVVALALAACSGSTTGAEESGSGQAASEPTPVGEVRPAGPVAAIAPLTGGNGPYIASGSPEAVASSGYVQQEYSAAGTATAYRQVGAQTYSGRWTFVPDGSAAYKTRILVRRPAKASAFSGNVIVEWLNVSGGVDADPEWTSLHEEIVRRGDAWVGVSAQRIGVNGGPVAVKVDVAGSQDAGKGLKYIDPARYGSLNVPGDGYSYDIYTQVARAIRSGAVLGGARPTRLIAAGESQSAFAMVTYYNGVQPLTHEFNGFFVHSRGAVSLPLVAPGQGADIAGALSGKPVIFRTDQVAPVMDIQTETDVLSILDSYAVRQPDTDRFRLWEVAGTAHADVHLVGASASQIKCGLPINNGPMHIVAKAAYRALTVWLINGRPPVIAPRIATTPGSKTEIRRDVDGIAVGGIRTPPVDVPVATLSGAPGPNPSTICLLVGSTKPFTAARLAQLYPSRAIYLQRYNAAADAAISAGFVLPADRPALLGYAEPSKIAS